MNGNQPGVQSPTSGDLIRVKKGAKLTVDINNAVCSSIELGYNSGNQDDRGSGTLFFLSSTSQVTVSGNVTIGDNPRLGSIDMTNGGVIIQNGNNSNFTLNNGFLTVEVIELFHLDLLALMLLIMLQLLHR
jgi:hypothetical protein